VYHEYENTSETPFNNPFFLILNVAMGGTFGGEVDPAFTESTMEVDYIKVYQ
jgi:beta-glucanase (GH16 family)